MKEGTDGMIKIYGGEIIDFTHTYTILVLINIMFENSTVLAGALVISIRGVLKHPDNDISRTLTQSLSLTHTYT